MPGAPAMYSFAGSPVEITMLNVAFTNDVPTMVPFTVAFISLTVTTCVAACDLILKIIIRIKQM